MKTLTASMILSVMFLSAGAFAGSSRTATALVLTKIDNITVINKNQAWPLPGNISVEPCNQRRCIDI